LVALFAALLLAAAPVSAVAHWVTHHANASDDGGAAPHAPICKLCVGLSAGSVAAPAQTPFFVVQPDLGLNLQSIVTPFFGSRFTAPFRSRAPPISLL
jgi:Protein of unknown function (DUF2946)